MGHDRENVPRRTGLLMGRPLRRSSALVNPLRAREGCPIKSRLSDEPWGPQSISEAVQTSSRGRASPATIVARAAKAGTKEKNLMVCGRDVRGGSGGKSERVPCQTTKDNPPVFIINASVQCFRAPN